MGNSRSVITRLLT